MILNCLTEISLSNANHLEIAKINWSGSTITETQKLWFSKRKGHRTKTGFLANKQ